MMTPSRLAPICLIAAGLLTTVACGPTYRDYRYSHRYDISRRAYDNGFREGLRHGRDDARDGRRFDYRHEEDYRRADDGYHRGDGDRDDYQRAYRQGFAAGYTEGYNRGRGRDGWRGPDERS
jgi:hypothetical protein